MPTLGAFLRHHLHPTTAPYDFPPPQTCPRAPAKPFIRPGIPPSLTPEAIVLVPTAAADVVSAFFEWLAKKDVLETDVDPEDIAKVKSALKFFSRPRGNLAEANHVNAFFFLCETAKIVVRVVNRALGRSPVPALDIALEDKITISAPDMQIPPPNKIRQKSAVPFVLKRDLLLRVAKVAAAQEIKPKVAVEREKAETAEIRKEDGKGTEKSAEKDERVGRGRGKERANVEEESEEAHGEHREKRPMKTPSVSIEIKVVDASRASAAGSTSRTPLRFGLFTQTSAIFASQTIVRPRQIAQLQVRELLLKLAVEQRHEDLPFVFLSDTRQFSFSFLADHPAGGFHQGFAGFNAVVPAPPAKASPSVALLLATVFFPDFMATVLPRLREALLAEVDTIAYQTSAAGAEQTSSSRPTTGGTAAGSDRGYSLRSVSGAGNSARASQAETVEDFEKHIDPMADIEEEVLELWDLMLLESLLLDYPDDYYLPAVAVSSADSSPCAFSATSPSAPLSEILSRTPTPPAIPLQTSVNPSHLPSHRRIRRRQTLRLSYPVGEGDSAFVYRGFLPDGKSYIVKVGKGEEGGEAVRADYEMRMALDASAADDLVPIISLLYEGEERYDGDEAFIDPSEPVDKKTFFVMEDGGDSLESWEALSYEERLQLFVSLLRLHQRHHILHGDTTPANVVILEATDALSPARARWISLSIAEDQHDCPMLECDELQILLGELELDNEEAQRHLKRLTEADGLSW
ncbi:hypothetical protein JCM11251_003316 [Rhodosporidiobolus azoricus]